MTLPTIDGLTPAQQARLDGELTARGLTTLAAQRNNIGGVVAALHAVFNVDATVVLAAYNDAEQATVRVPHPNKVGESIIVQSFKRGSKRGKSVTSDSLPLTDESEAQHGPW